MARNQYRESSRPIVGADVSKALTAGPACIDGLEVGLKETTALAVGAEGALAFLLTKMLSGPTECCRPIFTATNGASEQHLC